MEARIYKGLGKPVVFFGIAGDILPYVLGFWGICGAVCLIIGTVIGSLYGSISFIVSLVVGYLLASVFQDKFTKKTFVRFMSARGIPRFITIRTGFSRLCR